MKATNTNTDGVSFTTVTETGNVTWLPHVDVANMAVGWMAVHDDGRTEFVYLTPSLVIDPYGDDQHADVFLYHDGIGSPDSGMTVCYVDVFDGSVAP